MRTIQKSKEPDAFAAWKKSDNGQTQAFKKVPQAVRQEIKEALLREQLGLCCYCESKLIEGNFHIEHFRPQSSYPHLALNYQNLLCSCQSNLTQGEPRHCGAAKGDWFDENLTVSPLEYATPGRFHYTGDGRIAAQDPQDEGAKKTIGKLCLNSHKLVESRFRIIQSFLDPELSEEDFLKYIETYTGSLSFENPPEYVSAIKEVFGKG